MMARNHGPGDDVLMRAVRAGLLCLGGFSLPTLAQEESPLIYSVTLERLEYRFGDENDVGAWDGEVVHGGGDQRFQLTIGVEAARNFDLDPSLALLAVDAGPVAPLG